MAAVDVDAGQVQDGLLDVDGHGFASAEGRGAADAVAGVALGLGRIAGRDAFDAEDAGEIFGRHAAIAMHEHHQGLFGVGFKDECFDDGVLVQIEFLGQMAGAALFDEVVKEFAVGHLQAVEQADGGGDGAFVFGCAHDGSFPIQGAAVDATLALRR